MGKDKGETERVAIREAMKALADGRTMPNQSKDRELIILSMRQKLAGEPAEQVDEQIARLPESHRDMILSLCDEVARLRNKSPAEEMSRDLRALEFGVRVLQLRKQGMGKMKAMHEAHAQLGGDAISDQSMLDYHWKPFQKLVKSRGFVPYFSIDTESGYLAPTEFVPSDLDGQRGRPPKK